MDRKELSNFEKIWEYYSKEKKLEKNIKLLSLLHHRIAHLFLPMDIDLMGILEVSKNDTQKAEEYYGKAFNKNPPTKVFKDKLNEAIKIVNELAPEEKKEEILKLLNNPSLDLPQKFDDNWFKTHSRNPGENPFHKWLCELISALGKVKENI